MMRSPGVVCLLASFFAAAFLFAPAQIATGRAIRAHVEDEQDAMVALTVSTRVERSRAGRRSSRKLGSDYLLIILIGPIGSPGISNGSNSMTSRMPRSDDDRSSTRRMTPPSIHDDTRLPAFDLIHHWIFQILLLFLFTLHCAQVAWQAITHRNGTGGGDRNS